MLTLAMATTGAVDPCTAGIAEANLLVRGVTFLKGQQQGQTTTDGTPQAAPKTLQVSLATSTLFVSYGDRFQALTFPAGEGGNPTVQTMGRVPTNVPAGVWDWVLAVTHPDPERPLFRSVGERRHLGRQPGTGEDGRLRGPAHRATRPRQPRHRLGLCRRNSVRTSRRQAPHAVVSAPARRRAGFKSQRGWQHNTVLLGEISTMVVLLTSTN